MTLTAAEYHGGSIQVSSSTNLGLRLGTGRRIQMVTISATSKNVTLPPVTDPEVPFGKDVVWVVNVGTNSFTLKDSEGALSIPLATNEVYILHTIDNLVGARQFVGRKSTFG